MFTTLASLTLAAAALAAPAAAPVAAAPVAAAPEPASVRAELTLGSAVVDRQVQPLPDTLVAGQTIYAFTSVTGAAGTTIEHVWSCNGKELSRHSLDIGQSKRWRTWTRQQVRAGQCHVQRYTQKLLSLIQDGSIDPSFVITHRLKLDDAPLGYELFAEKRENCEKVVLSVT